MFLAVANRWVHLEDRRQLIAQDNIKIGFKALRLRRSADLEGKVVQQKAFDYAKTLIEVCERIPEGKQNKK